MLFLARLLAPEAFGLVAMATVAFQLAGVFISSGLGTALIRSKTVTSVDLNTVFYTNLLLSLIAYAALFSGSPYVADFYSQPELVSLIRVMGLIVFINAMKVVQTAVFTRDMDFKTQMKANTLSALVSGCLAVAAASAGLGVWSLVVQMLSSALVSGLVLWWLSQWRPALEFSGESFARLFGFGWKLLAEGLLQTLFENSYVLVIGRFFGAELTGLYYLAGKISGIISRQLTGAVQGVTFPALSTLQDDNAALAYKYRQIMQFMLFIIAPTMGLLAGLSPALFELMFDERWAGAVPYLQLLCIVGVLYPLHALNVNLLNVKGRSDLVLKVGLVKKTVSLTLLFLAIHYGVLGIVISQVIGSILSLVPNTYFSARLVGYSLFDQVKDVLPPISAAGLAGIAAWWVAHCVVSLPIMALLLAGMVGLLVYVVASILLGAEGAKVIWRHASNRLIKNR